MYRDSHRNYLSNSSTVINNSPKKIVTRKLVGELEAGSLPPIPMRKSQPEYETDFDDDFDYQLFKDVGIL